MSEFDKKISALTSGTDSTATDEYVIARGGSNFKISGALVAAGATKVGTLASLAVTGNVSLGADVVLSRGAADRLDLASGDSLNIVSGTVKIAGTDVLSNNTLGSGVTASSLTSVGTLSSLTVSGAITGATSTNTINGLIVNSGALSGISTISASGTVTVNRVTLSNAASLITTSTSDGTDNATLEINGGGGSTSARGASVFLAGNESASTGNAGITSGNVSGSLVSIVARAADSYILFISGGVTERARIPAAGGFQCVNSISVGNATPTTSGAGITFPATQSASTNANTLDDYEEGEFTPTVTFTTPGTVSTASAVGVYTKIGNVVTVMGRIAVTKGTASGDVVMGGLPFASINRSTYQVSGSLSVDDFGVTGKVYYILLVNNSTAPILQAQTQSTGGVAAVTAADFYATAGTIRYSLTYHV